MEQQAGGADSAAMASKMTRSSRVSKIRGSHVGIPRPAQREGHDPATLRRDDIFIQSGLMRCWFVTSSIHPTMMIQLGQRSLLHSIYRHKENGREVERQLPSEPFVPT